MNKVAMSYKSSSSQNFKQIQNQYLDSLAQIDRIIKTSVGCVNSEGLQKLNQEFKDAKNLLKEMELEAMSVSQNITQTKQEMQMHQMDLRDLKARFREMIQFNKQFSSSQMQSLEQHIIEIEEGNGPVDFDTDQNFFSGNLKLIQAKKDMFAIEMTANQIQKNIHDQNKQVDKMNNNLSSITVDIKDSDKNIKILQTKKYLTKYFIYFILTALVALFVYIIFEKVAYFF